MPTTTRTRAVVATSWQASRMAPFALAIRVAIAHGSPGTSPVAAAAVPTAAASAVPWARTACVR
ncbi:hypothetical protein [Curtobacterium sp. BRB10]|uniref:hypothetical protein n=1 Tax=Curtobacterium sp. BRB10 TaxID=2962579 RepID=UPI002881E343|nr:hypothetical protein [Curtobacterium sp. BRB10]MDT0232374.1 hypothetical protein [Curtobacterium sp. BRB10]